MNSINDDDLRLLLPTLDRIESVPPERVERLWAELETVLEDRPRPNVTALAPLAPHRAGRRSWAMAASVAAALAAMVIGVAVLTQRGGSPADDREPAVADVPGVAPEPSIASTSTVATVPGPSTIAEACLAFRRTIAQSHPFDSLGSSTSDVEALAAWVDGLGTLLADIDRVGRPDDANDQYLSIQLLRTALRTAIDHVEAGDEADAATSLSNARRHFDAIQRGESELTSCLAATDG